MPDSYTRGYWVRQADGTIEQILVSLPVKIVVTSGQAADLKVTDVKSSVDGKRLSHFKIFPRADHLANRIPSLAEESSAKYSLDEIRRDLDRDAAWLFRRQLVQTAQDQSLSAFKFSENMRDFLAQKGKPDQQRSEVRTDIMEPEAEPQGVEVSVVGESLPAKLLGSFQPDKHWKAPKRQMPNELRGPMEPTHFPGDDPDDSMYFHAMHSAGGNSDGLGATPSLQEALDAKLLRAISVEEIPVNGVFKSFRFLKMPETRPNEFVVFPDTDARLPQIMNPKAFEYMAAIKRALEESGE
jgi:hypothetical protein